MSIDFKPITLVNGQQQSHIAVADRGLAYGDGVFETLLLANGAIPLWQYHHARLLRGLQCLKIPFETEHLPQVAVEKSGVKQSCFEEDIEQLLALLEPLSADVFVIKLTVTRGEGGRGYRPAASSPTRIVTAFPYDLDRDKHQGIAVHRCQQQLPLGLPWAGLKTLNQLPYVLAAQERDPSVHDEGLLFSTENQLIEATARNIFIVKDEVLYTPRLNQCGVAGVMRQVILEKIAPQLGLTCRQSPLSLADLTGADEVFLTNSVSGIWPVVNYKNTHWPLGPITRSIQAMCHGLLGLLE